MSKNQSRGVNDRACEGDVIAHNKTQLQQGKGNDEGYIIIMKALQSMTCWNKHG